MLQGATEEDAWGDSARGGHFLVAAAVIAVSLTSGVQFASAVTTTRPLDVLRFQLHDPGTVPMVDGLVRNPTQTALTDVTVTIRFLSKTGTLLRTVKVPAVCIVLDGLATTTFRAVMREGEVYSKYITVTASGKPTFRRPLFLPVHLDSWTCWSDGAETGHNYTVSVTNDRPFDVVGCESGERSGSALTLARRASISRSLEHCRARVP